MKTSILIVDSQQLVRDGLRAVLSSESDFEVIGDVADGRSAVSLALQKRPQVAVVEGHLPRLSGIEAIRLIGEESPRTACVVITSSQRSAQFRQAMLAGAIGFVTKDSPASDLIDAVRSVSQRRSYLAPTVADQVVNALRVPTDGGIGTNGELTNRQREVLQLITEGLSTKEIAVELGISIKTAQTHRAKLMGRVGIRKASALVRYAIREGIVSA